MAAQGFKGTFRQSMSWLHTWVGLVLSVVLYFVFITGSFGYFNTEIDHWMKPEQAAISDLPDEKTLAQTGLNYLQQNAPMAKEYWITLPSGRYRNLLQVYAPFIEPNAQGETYLSQALNPLTGEPAASARETGGGDALYAMHYSLHYMPYDVAIYIVGIATMFMFIALVTGIVVHKKIFADFFTLRFNKGQRSWLDGHNMSSVLALPFLLMITYSGLVFYTFEYLPSIKLLSMSADENRDTTLDAYLYPGFQDVERNGVAAEMIALDAPLNAARARWPNQVIKYINLVNPGDSSALLRISPNNAGVSRSSESLVFNAVSGETIASPPGMAASAVFSDAMLALHEGHFAGSALRWLYFISGLVGAAMIATGLILWAKKRRNRLKKRGTPGFGLLFVERTNLGIIIGLPLAITAYFWANRLLPLNMVDRAQWEMHCLFIVWLLSFFHAGLREPSLAWREQVGLLAAMLLFLPVLNFLTTDVHLIASLAQSDWVRAGFDLTALLFGLTTLLLWRLMPNARQQSKKIASLSEEKARV